MQEFETRAVFFQWLFPNYLIANTFMRRIFLPDKVAPARCSFADCNAPLDRCMPNARSVDIEVGAAHLNALVECASLCVAIYYAYVQINKSTRTQLGLSALPKHVCLKHLYSRQSKTRVTSLLLSTICRSLPRSWCLANKRIRNASAKLQVSKLRYIEGLAQAAREQIRDRERMRTFEVYVSGRNHTNATMLVEAHFGLLVMAAAHLRMFYQSQSCLTKRQANSSTAH